MNLSPLCGVNSFSITDQGKRPQSSGILFEPQLPAPGGPDDTAMINGQQYIGTWKEQRPAKRSRLHTLHIRPRGLPISLKHAPAPCPRTIDISTEPDPLYGLFHF